MAGYQCVKNLQQQPLLKNTTHHKELEDNTIVGAETIVLLEQLEVIEKKG